jgi:hypothetical protein
LILPSVEADHFRTGQNFPHESLNKQNRRGETDRGADRRQSKEYMSTVPARYDAPAIERRLTMSVELEALPDQVRAQAVKMRELAKTIENAPLNEVVAAPNQLKAEIEALIGLANKASGRRV